MKTKALLALNNFIHINKLQHYDLMGILYILKYHYEIQMELEYIPRMSFEEFLATLQGSIWSKDNWEFWKNMYLFQGELNYYRETMSLEDAINEVIEEYDL